MAYSEADYKKLLIDLAYYRLPDGTEVQAIWTGRDAAPGETQPQYWILAHLDNPRDLAAEHLQYEVERSGRIIARYTSGLTQIDPPTEIGPNAFLLPDNLTQQPLRDETSATDLTIEDLTLTVNPWSST